MRGNGVVDILEEPKELNENELFHKTANTVFETFILKLEQSKILSY